MTSDGSASDLVWEWMQVGRPADTHFSAGGSSPLVRSNATNQLETHAVLKSRDEKDEDEESSHSDLVKVAAGIGVGVLLTVAAFKATPRVKRWLRARRAARDQRLTEGQAAGDLRSPDVVAQVTIPAFAAEVEVALDDHRTKMSSADAQRRLLAIMMAAAVIAENMRALSEAEIVDLVSPELQTALANLSVPQVAESLNRLLRDDPALLDNQPLTDLRAIFGDDDRSVAHTKVLSALRLPKPA